MLVESQPVKPVKQVDPWRCSRVLRPPLASVWKIGSGGLCPGLPCRSWSRRRLCRQLCSREQLRRVPQDVNSGVGSSVVPDVGSPVAPNQSQAVVPTPRTGRRAQSRRTTGRCISPRRWWTRLQRAVSKRWPSSLLASTCIASPSIAHRTRREWRFYAQGKWISRAPYFVFDRTKVRYCLQALSF